MMDRFTRERHIRIFLSSTFKDMNGERNYIIRRLFPKLRKVAAERDVIATIVDLRWGIPSEDIISGKVLESCFREIDNSIPFFIGLVGNWYGWVPRPVDIPDETLESYPIIEKYLRNQLSITEMEIQYGVLDRREDMHAFFYLKSEDQETTDARIAVLKTAILNNNRYPVNYYFSPEDLGNQIESAFLSLLDSLFPDKGIEPWERNRFMQLSYVHRLQKSYVKDIVSYEVLDRWLENESQSHLVVFGEPGCGKSALLANWMKHQQKSSYNCAYCSIGSGSGQYGWAAVSELLARQIIELYSITDSSYYRGWNEPLKDLFSQVEKLPNKKLLIIIDAVDQLFLPENHQSAFPLPIECPENVKILLSIREGHKTLLEFRDRGYTMYKIEPLKKEQRVEMITSYLSLFGKSLGDGYAERIAKSHLADNCLRLRILLDELVTWGGVTITEKITDYLSETDEGFYLKVFHDYRTEFGNACLEALAYVALSRSGLTESDIIGLSGLPPVEWSDFSHAFDRYLVSNMGLVSFSHDYLKSFFIPQEQDGIHLRLGEWLLKEDTERTKVEALYHYMLAGKVDIVASLIKDPDVFILVVNRDPNLLHSAWKWVKSSGEKLNISHFFTADNADFDFYMHVADFLKARIHDYDLAAWFTNSAFDWANNDEQKLASICLGAECLMLDWDPGRSLDDLLNAKEKLLKKYGESSKEVATISFWLGKYGLFFSVPKITIPHLEKALPAQREKYPYPSEDVAETLLCLGASYVEVGRFSDGDRALQEAEQIFLQTCGSYGASYLTTLLERSSLELHRGNFEDASALVNTVKMKIDASANELLYIRARLLEVEISGRKGDFRSANSQFFWAFNRIEQLFKRLVDVPPHIELLMARALFFSKFEGASEHLAELAFPFEEDKRFPIYYLIYGNWRMQKECFQEAKEKFTEGIELCEKYLGEDAPMTIELRSMLGIVLDEMGNSEEGLKCLRSVLSEREKVYGATHYLTISSRLELCNRDDTSFDEKLLELEDCIHILKDRYGDKPLLLIPYQLLKAVILIKQTRFQEACPVMSSLLEQEIDYLWDDKVALDEADRDLIDEICDAYEWLKDIDDEPYGYLLAVLNRDMFKCYGLRVQLLYYARIGQRLFELNAQEEALEVFIKGHNLYIRYSNKCKADVEKAMERFR